MDRKSLCNSCKRLIRYNRECVCPQHVMFQPFPSRIVITSCVWFQPNVQTSDAKHYKDNQVIFSYYIND